MRIETSTLAHIAKRDRIRQRKSTIFDRDLAACYDHQRVAREIVHVVMGGGIVFAAYRRPDLAHRHALCLTGATVSSLELDKIAPELRAAIEILEQLPPEIATDIAMDWEHDDDVTPTAESTSRAESRTATKESPPLVFESRTPTKQSPPLVPTKTAEESPPLTLEVSAIEDAPSVPTPSSNDDDPKNDPWEK
jgi:hypothetical protein